jgi:hypothetical protein
MITSVHLLKQAAHHEAAHAVAAIQFGFDVEKVDLGGDADSEAITIVYVPKPNGEGKEYISTIFNDAVVDLVGPVVNVHKFSDDWPIVKSRDYRAAVEKLTFYVLAKHDRIDPSDYDFLKGNRMTKEIFDYLMLERQWNKINGKRKLNKIMAKAEAEARKIVYGQWATITAVKSGEY